MEGMAVASLSGLLKGVAEKLASLLLEDYELPWGVKKKMENLRSTLSTIEAVLADAEERQIKDKAVRIWIGKLGDAAYDADNILDEFTTEALRRNVEVQGRFMNKVRDFFSLSNPLIFLLGMGCKIKNITVRLDAIAEERSKFHLNPREGERVPSIIDREPTDSFVIESEVVGRKEDKEKVIQLLIDAGDEEDISIIPVVGMGGVGKTTLAQLAYNDERVEKHFDLRMWVCVSDDFSVQRLTEAIIESATADQKATADQECVPQNMERVPQNMDPLQRCLREKLSERKFLLVLDDVWDENPEKWDRLKQYLRSGKRGSKILVTTRNQKVASIMGTLAAYNLERLSDDGCWSLFRQRAFPQGRQEEPNLVTLGKEIVKKCGGLPLAAKALGSLMMFKTEEREWRSVTENGIWNSSEEENDGILPALWLSYYHLPSHMKQCFAYCSMFPKDYLMEKRQLILLWMAEGFIPSGRGSKQMEDIGEEYFNNLVWRSFFQDVQNIADGKIVWCKMHDLMHDLACYVAGRSPAFSVSGVECRHLSIECNSGRLESTNAQALKNLRTLLLLTRKRIRLPPNISFNFKYLRVLDLRWVDITTESLFSTAEWLSSIGELKHLRYLDLSYTDIQTLPESISTLYNLQTLRLWGCYYLKNLPKDTMKMTSLRHLEMDSVRLTRMPAKIGELSSLQTLPFFIVGEESGCSIRELKGLNLHGSLSIEKLENVKGPSDAQEAKLNEKPNLNELRFSWGPDIDVQLGESVEETLERLRPHSYLRRLSMEEYVGIRFPNWLNSLVLPNLVEISLKNCRRCEQLPSFGRLPFLKVLRIRGMHAVKYFGSLSNELENFSSLSKLCIEDCTGLTSLTLKNLSSLSDLSISECTGLTSLTLENISSLTQMSISECTGLTSLTFENFSFLYYLPINQFTSLTSLTLKNLSSLNYLAINEFTSLTSLTFENFSSLYYLPITKFASLTSLTLKNLFSLNWLSISECPGLTSLTLENVSSFNYLSISKCIGLTSLTFENLSSFNQLSISKCIGLTSLMLKNLSSLNYLGIKYCTGLTSLTLENLSSLSYLKIAYCTGLTSVMLENLSSVSHLFIENCTGLTSLMLESFSSLSELCIEDCTGLTSLLFGHLSSLRNLFIRNCAGLTSLPLENCIGLTYLTLENLSSLSYLEIADCTGLTSLTLKNLSSLSYLGIKYCTSLTSLTLENLSSLKNLIIDYYTGLTSLTLKNLSFLNQLSISECTGLRSLTLQSWSSLRRFSLHDCQNLICLQGDMQNLIALKDLIFDDCPKLTCLPEGLQHIKTLKFLGIISCESLTALPEWIGNLSSLYHLRIWGCNNLTSLPCGLRRLTNLQHLDIVRNPQLEKRCEKEKGEDWDKISHIPNIHI